MTVDWSEAEYLGRPSVSPVVATLAAAGILRPGQRVLDAGCGRGTDAIALARMGFRRIDALDVNARALAAGRRRARRLGVDGAIRWRRGSALDLEALYGRAAFDAAIDTLLVSNLANPEAKRYLDQMARVLKPGALLVLQSKVWPRQVGTAEDGLPRAALRGFREAGRFGAHLAEGTGRRSSHVPVVVRLLRRSKKGGIPHGPYHSS